MKIYTLCGEEFEAEDVKEENETQYRIWFRTKTNCLVNRSFPKEDVLIAYSDVKHDEAHATIKEAYEAIRDNFLDGYGGYSACTHCYIAQIDGMVNHKENCIVPKVEQWLKENT